MAFKRFKRAKPSWEAGELEEELRVCGSVLREQGVPQMYTVAENMGFGLEGLLEHDDVETELDDMIDSLSSVEAECANARHLLKACKSLATADTTKAELLT